MAEVSVIVPVYKVEKYLRRCIDSILCQSFSDFDLILIDDGSPDHSGDICEEYKRKDPRVYVIHQENKGLSGARNAGVEWALSNSDSRWISFVDSDDWIHPDYLKKLKYAAEKCKTNISICGYKITKGEALPQLTEKEAVIKKPDVYYREDIVNATVSWGKLYRKECFLENRFPEGKLHEDEFTTYKILFGEKEIAIIQQPLYAYFQNEHGIMMQTWTPRRLDGLEAMELQLDYFLKEGFQETAGYTAARLGKHILRNQKCIMCCEELKEEEKQQLCQKLKKRLQSLIWEGRKYGWFKYRDNDMNKELYMEAFPALRSVRNIWRRKRDSFMKFFFRIKEKQFLFEELVKRDFKQKYKRTVLGMGWSILNPLLTLLVMRLVFTRFFGRNMEHYTTYLFAGNLMFSYFKESTNGGMQSLMSNANIFTKINVPKYMFLFSKNVSAVINFGLTLIVFFVFTALDHVPFRPSMFAVVYPIITLTMLNVGIGMILSAMFVFFRDTQYLYDVFTLLLMYMSAIFYNVDSYSEKVRRIFLLNPVYCNIKYVRVVVLEGHLPSPAFHGLLFLYGALALLIGGTIYRTCNQKFLYYV